MNEDYLDNRSMIRTLGTNIQLTSGPCTVAFAISTTMDYVRTALEIFHTPVLVEQGPDGEFYVTLVTLLKQDDDKKGL